MSDDEEPVCMGNLELYEGDLSVVIRSDGDVEFLIACEDEESDDYARCMNLVRFLKFALEDGRCREIFDRFRLPELN